MKFSIEEEAEKQLQLRINRDFARRDKNFGNARYVMNIVQLEILPAMAERLAAINSPLARRSVNHTLCRHPNAANHFQRKPKDRLPLKYTIIIE